MGPLNQRKSADQRKNPMSEWYNSRLFFLFTVSCTVSDTYAQAARAQLCAIDIQYTRRLSSATYCVPFTYNTPGACHLHTIHQAPILCNILCAIYIQYTRRLSSATYCAPLTYIQYTRRLSSATYCAPFTYNTPGAYPLQHTVRH